LAKDQTVPQMDFLLIGRPSKPRRSWGAWPDCPLNGLSPDSSKTGPHRESLQQLARDAILRVLCVAGGFWFDLTDRVSVVLCWRCVAVGRLRVDALDGVTEFYRQRVFACSGDQAKRAVLASV
jgi:hypothetical protein